MTEQLSLFPESPLTGPDSLRVRMLVDLDTILNPVDEVFAVCTRFRKQSDFIELLRFIARFGGYSAFNGFLLYLQNSSATHVATARSWKQKFGRRPKDGARPIIILAPMAPILFVFDILDTEGPPLPSGWRPSTANRVQLTDNVYTRMRYNCAVHGIVVLESAADQNSVGNTSRITPALRKRFQDSNLPKDTSYLILVDETLPLENKYASLVHELGHIFCGHLGVDRHAWWPEREDLDVIGEGIEADATAFLVCERLGLKTSSVDYLTHLMQADQNLPLFSLSAVLQSVGYIEDMGKSRWKSPRKRRR